MKGFRENRNGIAIGTPNRVRMKKSVPEAEMTCMAKGDICKDPQSNPSYLIEWPEPSKMTLLIIKKPHDEAIEKWTREIISYPLT